MKIYLASSWKNVMTVKSIADTLRQEGHDVDVFCETREGRTIFSFSEVPNADKHNAKSMLCEPVVQRAFLEDKKWIDWADVVIMILPCGNSAHLEAGYAKGSGKELYIYGNFEKGKFDVMYGFADGLYEHIDELMEAFK